ncbi:energy transducer TonB [Sphingopyxis sp. MWB1]|uniref:energy transducer TonB n=1 Tax=Sphingopyxis sp. MWB1 TaxID=1537715 RepID=UPI000A44CC6D|nr:energy transducer TonB [Sphingopyxis sp. MWB1]
MAMVAAPRIPGHWLMGGAAALTGHVLVGGLILAAHSDAPPPVELEPVVLVELPPLAAPAVAPAAAPATPSPSLPTPTPQMLPRVEAPPVAAPLPREVVAAAPRPVPMRAPVPLAPPTFAAAAAPAPSIAAPPAPADRVGDPSATPGNDPRARKEEADYFSLLSGHLNRKKTYPSEAKKARQQGVVTVRFTVHSDGAISGASIKRSSGHALLDQATLDLLQRVAPLPRFPKSMNKDSVTLSLPIDYSLRTK